MDRPSPHGSEGRGNGAEPGPGRPTCVVGRRTGTEGPGRRPGGFETLVRRYLPRVHGLALSILADADTADDVSQDTFISALRRIDQLRSPHRFRSWILTIARNRSLNTLEAAAGRSGPPLESVQAPARGGGPEDALEKKEIHAALTAALRGLTSTQQNVFVLHELEGMDHREISSRLGISSGSSRVHLHMARRALRDDLGPVFRLGEEC